MKKYILALGLIGLMSLNSCISDGEETILLEDAVSTDIPSDNDANPNPELYGSNTTNIPNIQYNTVSEDGTIVIRLDMTGIQNRENLEYLRLYGTGEGAQNVWVEIDGKPKGIKVYNTIDDSQGRSLPVDLVFLVDNSGSMDQEADAIARDIESWTASLGATSLDIRFACIGYDGTISGGIDFTDARNIASFLNRNNYTGTYRTIGFIGDLGKVSTSSYNGRHNDESAMAALRFADENLTFRSNANRIYVNFTDEPNTPPNHNQRFSVESLLTDWDPSRGTIHTVYSDGDKEYKQEYNYLMSEYTGGSVIYTSPTFEGVTLENLPVTGAMRNSYIIRFKDVEGYLDGKVHQVHITVKSEDGRVQSERTYNVVFSKTPTNMDGDTTDKPNSFHEFNGGFGDYTGFGGSTTSGIKKAELCGTWLMTYQGENGASEAFQNHYTPSAEYSVRFNEDGTGYIRYGFDQFLEINTGTYYNELTYSISGTTITADIDKKGQRIEKWKVTKLTSTEMELFWDSGDGWSMTARFVKEQ